MSPFLIRSALFLVLALLITIGVFFWLNSATVLPTITEQVQTFRGVEPTKDIAESSESAAATSESFSIPSEGIKLSSLALGDSQRKALEAAGINIETFIITEAVISCGVGKLGDARATEIFGGATPTIIETGKLLPCLSR